MRTRRRAGPVPRLAMAPHRPAPLLRLACLFLAIAIGGCATGAGAPVADVNPGATINVGRAKQGALAYQRSGAYARDFAAVIAQAQAYVEQRASQVSRPAVVLDIDETALSNWPSIAANDFGYIPEGPCDQLPKGPCGAHAWENASRAEVLAPTLALYQSARQRGVAVFFISGRDEAQRAATELNLRRAGYADWAGVVLRPPGPREPLAANYKAPRRARIAAQGYTIIANVGDQESDLAGGYAERSFLLPNPFYFIP